MQKAGRGYTALQRLSPDPALTMGSTPACLSLKSRAREKRGSWCREAAMCGLCTPGSQAARSFRKSLEMKAGRSSTHFLC